MSYYTLKLIPRVRFETILKEHGLTLEVQERMECFDYSDVKRFAACIPEADIKEGCILRSGYGTGNTAEEAVASYAKSISGKLLVIRAMSPDRREIQLPPIIDP